MTTKDIPFVLLQDYEDEMERKWMEAENVVIPFKKARSIMRKYRKYFTLTPNSILYKVGDHNIEINYQRKEGTTGRVVIKEDGEIVMDVESENLLTEFGNTISYQINMAKLKIKEELS